MVGGSREGSARLGCPRLTGLRRPRTTHGDGSTQLVVAFARRARCARSPSTFRSVRVIPCARSVWSVASRPARIEARYLDIETTASCVTFLAWECPRANCSSRRTVKQARRLVTRVPCAFTHAFGERPRALCTRARARVRACVVVRASCVRACVRACVCVSSRAPPRGHHPAASRHPSNRAKYERRCVKCAGSERRIVAPRVDACARGTSRGATRCSGHCC